jgi:hypothetical protein
MIGTPKDVGFAAALALALIAGACGPSAPPPETPATPPEGPAPTPPGGPQGPEAPPAGTATPGAKPTAGPPSTPIQPSKLLDDLKKAGINLAAIGPLEKVPLATKKKVMPLFQKSLGFEACTGCHVEGDFKKDTHNMKVARQMWNHFVVQLRDEKGGNVFCDSCHSGKAQVLNRSDKDAVKKFMESDYVGKLARADKKDHECATCHGDAMELKIIDKLWAIPK